MYQYVLHYDKHTHCVQDSSSVYCMHLDNTRRESSHHDRMSQETGLQHTASTHTYSIQTRLSRWYDPSLIAAYFHNV